MKKLSYVIIWLVLPFLQGIAGVRLELSKDKITLDDSTSLHLIMDGMLQARMPQIPLPDGLYIIANSRRTVTGSSGTQTRITYEIQAKKPGNFSIGPYDLETVNGTQTLSKVTLQVTPAKTLETSDEVFATIDISTDTALVRETVRLTITFYSLHSIEDILRLDDMDSDDFGELKWGEVSMRSRTVNGKRYKARRIEAQLTPTKAGTYTFHPSVVIQIISPTGVKRTASGMMRQGFERKNIRLQPQEPVSLTVTTAPVEGRPADFQGHIGRFILNASLSPTDVSVGDPLTLRIQLSGSGSIREALPPRMEESDDFKAYEAKLVTEDIHRNGRSGSKTLEQVLIPQHADITEVPALHFSYYDSNTKQYVTRTVGPFPITVKGRDTAPSELGMVNAIGTSGNGQPISPTVLGTDLIYLKTTPTRLEPLNDLKPNLTFGVMAGLPLVLWVTCALGMYIKHPERQNLDASRRKQAPKQLRIQLATLEESAGNQQDLYARIWTCLSGYLRDQFTLPAGELSIQPVTDQLKTSVSEETLAQLTRWMHTCEQARFGALSEQSDPKETLGSFREFMVQLNQEIRS